MANVDILHSNHSGVTVAVVGSELRLTAAAQATVLAKVHYSSANARWEYANGDAAVFTGRTYAIGWEGTAAQIPTQGTGDAQFQTGDIAFVRATSL